MFKARFDKETILPLMEAAGYLREEDFLASLSDERRELHLRSSRRRRGGADACGETDAALHGLAACEPKRSRSGAGAVGAS